MAQATTLTLENLFTVTAGQTYGYEILGEGISSALLADESIKLEVP